MKPYICPRVPGPLQMLYVGNANAPASPEGQRGEIVSSFVPLSVRHASAEIPIFVQRNPYVRYAV